VRNPFPDPRKAPKHGLLTVGGNLSVELLLAAYDHGIFPWFNEGERPHWWSPDPRAVMDLDHLHVSRSLARQIRSGGFSVTWNRCFQRVMEECGRHRREGTWIIPAMLHAYVRLYESGCAHSIEVWRDGALTGGLYGVQRGGAFMAESMFHRETGASKIALVRAIEDLWAAGVRLFDVQFLTPHLESMGAYEIPREEYLNRLAVARSLSARSPGA
jgi:leucyl/phenylalanyl-tRNA--protein transferase